MQISGLCNNSPHNSINILSSNSTRNSISLILSYVQTITHNMDSFEIHCAQHGLLWVIVHITRFPNNRVMCMTTCHSGHYLVLKRTKHQLFNFSAKSTELWRTRTMASQWRRDNKDGPTDWSPHFFKIILPNAVQEGKLVSMLKFMIFFLSKNHMLIHVVHLIFFICDSWKNLHLLHVVIKTFILQYVGHILRRTQSHNRVLLHQIYWYEQKMKQG